MEVLALDTCNDLLERGLVEWCAPTLASLKPASMFNITRFHEVRRLACGRTFLSEYAPWELDAAVDEIASRLAPLGVRMRIMAVRRGSMMVFVYRPDLLERFIQRDDEAALLELEGYDVADADACVTRLRSRVLDFDAHPRNPDGTDRFPHEMGFLLGYPLDDVLGFMRDRAHPLLRGHWNVHADVARAQRLFSLYDVCATLATTRRGTGEPLESLACVPFCSPEALLALYA